MRITDCKDKERCDIYDELCRCEAELKKLKDFMRAEVDDMTTFLGFGEKCIHSESSPLAEFNISDTGVNVAGEVIGADLVGYDLRIWRGCDKKNVDDCVLIYGEDKEKFIDKLCLMVPPRNERKKSYLKWKIKKFKQVLKEDTT